MTKPITDREIEALAKAIGINTKQDSLGLNLGFRLEDMEIYKAENYSNGSVTHKGTKRMLKDFRDKTKQKEQRTLLKQALKDADLVRLAEIHLGDEDSEEEDEYDEDEDSEGEDDDEDESSEEEDEDDADEPAGVSQRGGRGSQIINASGRAVVKGNKMTGSVKNVTHNYYRARAKSTKGKRKTVKSSGRKRKAVESSGGKRKAKRKK